MTVRPATEKTLWWRFSCRRRLYVGLHCPGLLKIYSFFQESCQIFIFYAFLWLHACKKREMNCSMASRRRNNWSIYVGSKDYSLSDRSAYPSSRTVVVKERWGNASEKCENPVWGAKILARSFAYSAPCFKTVAYTKIQRKCYNTLKMILVSSEA